MEDILKQLRGGEGDQISALERLQGMLAETPNQQLDQGTGEAITEAMKHVMKDTWTTDPPTRLTTIMSLVLKTLEYLVAVEGLHPSLQRDNKILSKLSFWNVQAQGFSIVDVERYTRVIEVLTRNISIVFKPTFLKPLLGTCSHIIRNRSPFSPSFDSVLSILVHLCDANPVCVLTIQCLEEIKEIWKILKGLQNDVKDDSKPLRTFILSTHLLMTLDYNANVDIFAFGLGNAVTLSERLFKTRNSDSTTNAVPDFTTMLESLVHRLEIEIGPDPKAFFAGKDSPVDFRIRGYVLLLTETVNYMSEGGPQCIAQKPELTKYFLRMIKGLTPKHKLVDHVPLDSFMQILQIFNSMEIATNRTCSLHDIYDGYAHILSHMCSFPNNAITPQLRSFVTDLLARTKLQSDGSAEAARYNSTCCRIYTIAQTFPTMKADVLKKVEQEGTILEDLLRHHLIDVGAECEVDLDRVACVVAVLEVLASNSSSKKVLDILLKGLNSYGASQYLAVAIHSNNPSLIASALSVTTAVAFSRENLRELTNSLARRATGIISSLPAKTVRHSLTPRATQGLAVVEEALEHIGATVNYEDMKDTSLPDIISMYGIKVEFMETELQRARDDIHRLGQAMVDLQKLLSKQLHVSGIQVTQMEIKDRKYRELKKTEQELAIQVQNQQTIVNEKTQGLLKKLVFKDKAMSGIEKNLREQVDQNAQLQAKLKELVKAGEKEKLGRVAHQKQLEELQKLLKTQEEANKGLAAQIKTLERDLSLSSEEHKRLEHLLAKEKQKVDVIRGVLGNNGSI